MFLGGTTWSSANIYESQCNIKQYLNNNCFNNFMNTDDRKSLKSIKFKKYKNKNSFP